jgi:hypothetical protein
MPRQPQATIPRIQFDDNVRLNPLIHDFLRDYTAPYIDHYLKTEPGWKLRMTDIATRATVYMMYDFDFPDYHHFPSGVYRDKLKVCPLFILSRL